MILIGAWKKTKIVDLVPGKVCTIKGKISASSKLSIPSSKTSCVYYEMLEERFGKGARGTGRALWFPDRMESKSVEFSVSDDSGTVQIRESGPQFSVKGAHQESGAPKGSRKRRFFASFLQPGDVVVIRGLVNAAAKSEGYFISAPPNAVLKVKVSHRFAG